MTFLDDIKDKTIIVCPNNVKSKLLTIIDGFNRLINVKFYSLDELKKYVYFDYDVSAILYLMDKYNYSYETSKNYIDNIYYISSNKYNSDKLNFLVRLKNELIDNQLLIFNKCFVESNKNIPFIVFGYDYLNTFEKNILSNFNYKFISKKLVNFSVNVYDFNTMEDEILFVINKIIELINNKVDINSIYLLNLDSSYNNEILRLFKMFNIPVEISKSSNILSTVIGKEAFNKLCISHSFSDTLDFIESYGLNNSFNQTIYNNFLNVFNKYVKFDYSFDLIISAVKYDLMNICINNNDLKNKVRVGNLYDSFYLDDEYVFLVGFNQGVVPRVFKDEEYISDSIKKEVQLDSVNIINKLERESTINNIQAIKNIFVSFKRNYLDSEFYPSNLINNSLFNVIKDINLCTDGSLAFSRIKLACMLDDFIKYDKKNNELSKYFNSFDIRYMDFNNKFKGISKDSLYNCLSNNLVLSYSTIDTFYKCQFRYYLDNILKLNKYDETFDTLIGSLFHYVLSHVYDKEFDMDELYNYYLKDKEFSNKELFYLEKLRQELRIICNRLNDFQNDTGLTNVFTEKNIKIDKSTNISVIFKGIVDKIMYKDYDGKTLLSIIDYKTGNADIDIFNSIYGIGMQLIVYLYLITKSDLFTNFSCVGFYLQKILSGEVNIENGKSYLDIKNDNLKLVGYSCDNPLFIERFDSTYENSSYIKSMKTTKNGFGAYSKVLDENTMNGLIDLVDKKIDNARDLILDCDFSINPKHISDDKEITGCKFCKYKDICFRNNDNIVNLKKYKDLNFLNEGDDDA